MKVTELEFLLGEEKKLSFKSDSNEISNIESPYKELFNVRKGDDFKVVINNNKENSIALSDLCRLSANIKDVGIFDLFFDKFEFKTEDILKQIIALKEIEVNNTDEAKSKVQKLFALFKNSLPLFVCYTPKGQYVIQKEDLDIGLFVLLVKVAEQPVFETNKTPKKVNTNNSVFGKIADFFSPVAENSVHYLFILISSFLIGFSSSIGIYYCYANNKAFYFLFICSAVGAILNFFVYFDYFKKHTLYSKDTALTLIDVVLGIGISIASFLIFYALQKEKPEALKSPLVILLIVAAVIIAINAFTCAIAFLLSKGNKKNK